VPQPLSECASVRIGCPRVLIVGFLFDKLPNRFKLEARMTEEQMIRPNNTILQRQPVQWVRRRCGAALPHGIGADFFWK
jgi:hypothetical protein